MFIRFILIIFLASVLGCILPLILELAIPSSNLISNEIFYAFESTELKVVLVSCLILTIPVLLEILRDFTLFRSSLMSYNATFSNLFLSISIIFPDLIILWLALPRRDVRLFVCVSQLRLNAVVTSFSVYIVIIGGKYWQRKRVLLAYALGMIGNVGMTWTEFVPGNIYQIALILSITSIVTGVAIFSFDVLKWFIAVYMTLKDGQALSTNEFCCNVYILAAAGFYCAHCWTYFAFGFPRYCQYNTEYLVLYNFYFGALFVTISVFQGGVARREAIFQNTLKVRKTYIRYISHEIRTPLNAVKLGLQLLSSELRYLLDSSQAELLDSLDVTQAACGEAVHILNEMLAFDKIEGGNLKLEPQTVSARELIESSVSIFQAQAAQGRVTMTCDIFGSPGLVHEKPGVILAPENAPVDVSLVLDKGKIGQVIHNLVSNALKFTPKGGRVTIAAKLVQAEGADERELLVEVADSGAGISKENLGKVFREFTQFKPEKLQAGGGSGLGLYSTSRCSLLITTVHSKDCSTSNHCYSISCVRPALLCSSSSSFIMAGFHLTVSKSIIELHGGKISVWSEGEGKGCVFTFRLPLDKLKPRIRHGSSHGVVEGMVASEEGEGVGLGPVSKKLKSLNISKMLMKKYPLSRLFGGSLSRHKILVSGSAVVAPLLLERQRTREEDKTVLARGDGSRTPVLSVGPQNPLRSKWCDSKVEEEHWAALTHHPGNADGSKEDSEGVLFRRLLVVDDALSNRRMMCRLFRRRCLSVEEAADGAQAVEKVRGAMQDGSPYDLVFMDNSMPVMDGPSAARVIREMGFQGIICGLTGNVLETDRDEFMECGASFVLFKPFDQSRFDKAMEEILGGKVYAF